MKRNTDNNTPYYNRSGIYKLTCNTCKLAYVGQTSRIVKHRFQEYTRYIRYNNHNQHTHNTSYTTDMNAGP